MKATTVVKAADRAARSTPQRKSLSKSPGGAKGTDAMGGKTPGSSASVSILATPKLPKFTLPSAIRRRRSLREDGSAGGTTPRATRPFVEADMGRLENRFRTLQGGVSYSDVAKLPQFARWECLEQASNRFAGEHIAGLRQFYFNVKGLGQTLPDRGHILPGTASASSHAPADTPQHQSVHDTPGTVASPLDLPIHAEGNVLMSPGGDGGVFVQQDPDGAASARLTAQRLSALGYEQLSATAAGPSDAPLVAAGVLPAPGDSGDLMNRYVWPQRSPRDGDGEDDPALQMLRRQSSLERNRRRLGTPLEAEQYKSRDVQSLHTALIIAVARYTDKKVGDCPRATADAFALAAVLKRLGYRVVMLYSDAYSEAHQPTRANIAASAERFTKDALRMGKDCVPVVAFFGRAVVAAQAGTQSLGEAMLKGGAAEHGSVYLLPEDFRAPPNGEFNADHGLKAQATFGMDPTNAATSAFHAHLFPEIAGAKGKAAVPRDKETPALNPTLLIESYAGVQGISRISPRPENGFGWFNAGSDTKGGDLIFDYTPSQSGLLAYYVLKGLSGAAVRDGKLTTIGLIQFVRGRLSGLSGVREGVHFRSNAENYFAGVGLAAPGRLRGMHYAVEKSERSLYPMRFVVEACIDVATHTIPRPTLLQYLHMAFKDVFLPRGRAGELPKPRTPAASVSSKPGSPPRRPSASPQCPSRGRCARAPRRGRRPHAGRNPSPRSTPSRPQPRSAAARELPPTGTSAGKAPLRTGISVDPFAETRTVGCRRGPSRSSCACRRPRLWL
eukprot:TRINITY_DN994_c0_g1_i10.p1 TRINITY_DN994_c0_g1~~TRINITY_DN994_c0_g1_i10.p1  ORF type:complete len:785 (+),score=207.52 TRINITY_DN994_c0_g1_i10:617-2971(+)